MKELTEGVLGVRLDQVSLVLRMLNELVFGVGHFHCNFDRVIVAIFDKVSFDILAPSQT